MHYPEEGAVLQTPVTKCMHSTSPNCNREEEIKKSYVGDELARKLMQECQHEDESEGVWQVQSGQKEEEKLVLLETHACLLAYFKYYYAYTLSTTYKSYTPPYGSAGFDAAA